MVAGNEFLPTFLVLFVTAVFVSLAEVQSQTTESTSEVQVHGQYHPDGIESVRAQDLQDILAAINSNQPSTQFWKLVNKWEDEINKDEWVRNSTKKRAKEIKDKEFLKIAFTTLFYYRTKQLLEKNEITNAMKMFQTLKSARQKWPGVPAKELDQLEREINRRVYLKHNNFPLY